MAASDLLRGTAPFRAPSLDGSATAPPPIHLRVNGLQKGVMLSHSAILANIRAFGETAQPRPDDKVVSWLPLYHDMGLIGTTLGTLALSIPTYLMSPTDFTRDPVRWMWAIHRFRATILVGTNSAIARLARMCRISPRRFERHQTYGDADRLDLSCLRIMMNGSEPVTVQAMEAFQREFGPFGLRRRRCLRSMGWPRWRWPFLFRTSTPRTGFFGSAGRSGSQSGGHCRDLRSGLLTAKGTACLRGGSASRLSRDRA